jgi:elongation factor P
MYATNQFRKGLKVEIDGIPFEIVDFQHVSPGKGRAFTRTKLRNLLNQNVIERTITSGDKLDKANIHESMMQYLYKDAAGFHFMDNNNYEQMTLQEEQLGKAKEFLQENISIRVMFFNERPIGVELPTFVVLKITQTDPAFKGDTVTGGTKPAVLETGASVNVPFHLKEGDLIKVDTRDYSYVEKANK